MVTAVIPSVIAISSGMSIKTLFILKGGCCVLVIYLKYTKDKRKGKDVGVLLCVKTFCL